MICTGSIMASFQIPIIFIGLLIGSYITELYGPMLGIVSSLTFTIVGLTIFSRWYWGEWPFIRKLKPSEDDS